jgi:hypothetical protein
MHVVQMNNEELLLAPNKAIDYAGVGLDNLYDFGRDIRLVSFGMLSCRCRTTSTFLRLSRELSPIEAQDPSGTEVSAYFYLIVLIVQCLR